MSRPRAVPLKTTPDPIKTDFQYKYGFYSEKYPSQEVVLIPMRVRRNSDGVFDSVSQEPLVVKFVNHHYFTNDDNIAKMLREHPEYGKRSGFIEIERKSDVVDDAITPKGAPPKIEKGIMINIQGDK